MKKTYLVLSVMSFIAYALVDFCKNALETHFHIQLMNGNGNFASSDYMVDTQICQVVLLSVGIVLLGLFIFSFFVKKSDSRSSE